MVQPITDEQADKLAEQFHNNYEKLAPEHGYKTREESAKPWAEVPEQNKELMRNVMREMFMLDDSGQVVLYESLNG